MRKLIFIFLLFPLVLQGQVMKTPGRFGFYTPPILPAYPEILTDGDFSEGETYWTIVGGWTIADGVATYGDVVSSTFWQAITSADSLQASTDYILTFDVTIASGNAYMQFSNKAYTVTYVALAYYANGSHSVEFTTPANIFAGGFNIRGHTGSSGSFTLDNISLKRI
jgi:hypothetical protein